jgi:GTP-binding protein
MEDPMRHAPVVSGQEALGWLHTARFLTTSPDLLHLPAPGAPELAFVGRSNAGKSTCINTLTQHRRLAFASRTPGRTQDINLFALGRQGQTNALLADLPGYGYAAVPKQAKVRWQQVMANYLVQRPGLAGLVLLCDARHGLTELDHALLDLMAPRVAQGMPYVLALTKADKLSRAEGLRALSIAKLNCRGGEAMLFSATRGVGVEALAQRLWQWAHAASPTPAVNPEAA